MAEFKAHRVKHKADVVDRDTITEKWVYGKLKDNNLSDIYPKSIIVSKNRVYIYPQVDNSSTRGFFGTENDFYKGTKLLKWIDSKGKYRLYPFNCRFEVKNEVEKIGTINKTVTSLLRGQSDKRELGVKKECILSLVAHNCNMETSIILSDIITSPVIYLYIGDNTPEDKEKDWLLVSCETNQTIARPRKNEFQNIIIDIKLPTQFSITKI